MKKRTKGISPNDEEVELGKLRDMLDSNDLSSRKQAAKKVCSLMRAGENVGNLFSSMLRCVRTDDMELKRLVYHYIVTYSLEESEQSIMVVNTFIHDMQDSNPLVRALAIRTMSRIRIENVVETMVIPLKSALRDNDPYVRKTAVLAVSKLYEIIPETIENAEMFKAMTELLSDENPMVVSNTTIAILEINERRSQPIFVFERNSIVPILNALPNCSSWCQTILFDALAKYEPEDSDTAASLIDRLTPFLKSADPSVVIGAFKCIFLFMEYDERPPKEIFPQIVPPFIGLVSGAEPEIQYVVLRTLSLFVNKYPKALSKEIRLFFCKYNDPSYIKMEKLNIIVANSNISNCSIVLDEFSEYTNSVDMHFVRKTIKCIGQIAMKLPTSSRTCVDILVKLVDGKADYAVEESIIVLCDILRKYPGNFEGVIGKVCSNVESVKEPRARAALVWILGEYCGLIEKVDLLIDPFLDTFHDEEPEVQLQIITAFVKIYLEKIDDTKDQLQFVFNESTKETVLPDVRNRSMIFWRLLSMDQAAARRVVMFTKDCLGISETHYTDEVLTELIRNMGTVSGVLHIIPSKFQSDVYTPEDEDESARHWKPLPIRNSPSPIEVNSDWDPEKYYLNVINVSGQVLNNFALAVNTNGAGFTFDKGILFPEKLDNGEEFHIEIPFYFSQQTATAGNSAVSLDFAFRTSVGNVFFTDFIDFRLITKPFTLYRKDFLDKWRNEKSVIQFDLDGVSIAERQALRERNIFIIAERDNEMCIAFELAHDMMYLGDLEYRGNQMHVTLKGDSSRFPFLQESAKYAFCNE